MNMVFVEFVDTRTKSSNYKDRVFFHTLCSKVIDLTTIPNLMECVAEAVCLFEMWFPPGFFDIMMHLPIHLVEE